MRKNYESFKHFRMPGWESDLDQIDAEKRKQCWLVIGSIDNEREVCLRCVCL